MPPPGDSVLDLVGPVLDSTNPVSDTADTNTLDVVDKFILDVTYSTYLQNLEATWSQISKISTVTDKIRSL